MLATLNPVLIRETLNKVNRCMARLQELQYTVTGGANKVVSGVNLSPRSTAVYLRTSLRCYFIFIITIFSLLLNNIETQIGFFFAKESRMVAQEDPQWGNFDLQQKQVNGNECHYLQCL